MTKLRKDWTQNEEGRSNSSKLYLRLATEVQWQIENHALALLRGRTHDVARGIVSYLAHERCLAPEREIDILERDDEIADLKRKLAMAQDNLSAFLQAIPSDGIPRLFRYHKGKFEWSALDMPTNWDWHELPIEPERT